MEWYWWVVIAWPIFGIIALVMHIRDTPELQENIGLAEIWPVIFGPFWFLVKTWQWVFRLQSA